MIPAFLLLLLLGCTSTGTSVTQVEEAGEDFGFELTRDWRTLSILLTTISAIVVAAAYMFGHGFEIPELKAWASVELVQIVATALIVLTFGMVLTLLDSAVAGTVNASPLGISCDALESCATTTATAYIDGLIDMASGELESILDKSLKYGSYSSSRYGVGSQQAFWPPFLQSSTSFSPSSTWAGYAMTLELETQAMQWQTDLLSILSSQRFFVTAISFKLAPVILLLGIVGRSIFVTRKLGGLLMAIGFGVMFVFPAMYVVNWLSLAVTLSGDQVLTPPAGLTCPRVCTESVPQFYSSSLRIQDTEQLLLYTPVEDITPTLQQNVRRLRDGEISSLTIPTGSGTMWVGSCEAAAHTDYGYCPVVCRTMPLLLGEECTFLNETVTPTSLYETATSIVDIKKACYDMPRACRLAYNDPLLTGRMLDRCPEICRTTLPLKYECSEACLEARDYCRVARKEGVDSPVLVPISLLVDQGALPPECDAANVCDQSLDPFESCVYVQPSPDILDLCSGCMLIGREFTYDPVTYTDCAQRCGGESPGAISPAQFAQATRGQMTGRPEITGISALIIPAYILPLLNVVVTLTFIRTFSPILGGDVEIPGVARLL